MEVCIQESSKNLKRASDTLELRLKGFLNFRVDDETPNSSPLQEQKVLLDTEPSHLSSPHLLFIYAICFFT